MTVFCNDTPAYKLAAQQKAIALNKKGLKVYCRDCFYFDSAFLVGVPFDSMCKHPKNREDSFYKPDAFYTSTPQERNKNNDCGDYEEKT